MQHERAALHHIGHPSSPPPNHIHNSLSRWLPASSWITVRCCGSSQSTAAHPHTKEQPNWRDELPCCLQQVAEVWDAFSCRDPCAELIGKTSLCRRSSEKASSPPPLVTLINLPYPQLMPKHGVHLYHFLARSMAACSGREQVLFPALT